MIPPLSAEPLSYWLETAPKTGFPPLSGENQADVVILGGGLAGLSAAWSLLEGGLPGANIVLLEARSAGSAATGRNAGFLLADLAEPYVRLRGSMGEKAKRLRQLGLRNQRSMRQLAEECGFDWQADQRGVLVAAASAHEETELKQSVEALNADGFQAEYLPPNQVAPILGFATDFGGMWDGMGGGSQPAKYAKGLAQALAERGVRLHDSSPASALQCLPDGTVLVEVESQAAQVRAERVIMAMNAYSAQLDPTLGRLISARRGQMLSFAPTEIVLQPIVYRNHGYEYFRQDQTGRFFFGGFRHLAMHEEVGYEEILNQKVQQKLLDFAHQHYPQLRAMQPDSRWSGIMGFSNDGLPLVGPHPSKSGVVLCAGFSGHGLNLAAEAGRIAADLVLAGSAEDADLFSPRRLL